MQRVTSVVVAFAAAAVLILCLSPSASATDSYSRVLVALTHRNLPVLEKLFWQVADPASNKYGEHLTRDQIAAIIAPSQSDVDRVVEWLRSQTQQRVRDLSLHDSRDFLTAYVPTSSLPSLREERRPKDIARLVDHISEFTPLDGQAKRFDIVCNQQAETVRASVARNNMLTKAAVSGTPENQRKSYDIPENQRGSNKKNSQMVWGPCTYGVLDSDLHQFYQTFDVKASVSNVKREGYHGFPGGDNFGEATLDTEYITAIGVGVPTIVSNTNNSATTEEDNGFGDALLQFVSNLASKADVPNVISMSLGSLSWGSIQLMCTEAAKLNPSVTYQACQSYLESQRQVSMYTGFNQLARIDVEFMKLGLRGVTLLAATGDGGSHFSFVRFPQDQIGQVLNTVSCMFQMPTFPASSAYVLGVGGTQWDGNDIKRPVHWSSGGGGFSWQFPMPEYQRSAVQKYLEDEARNLPPATSFNRSNRAYPDVSALANNIPIVMQGQVMETGGTSASTPEFAGLISLINDHRLDKGLKPLGFVNKRLYDIAAKHPGEAFYDVDSGNTNCDVEGFCCNNGFASAKGWDPVTGLGSPLFPGLLKYLGTNDDL